MNKSVVIVGKGISVLKCDSTFLNKFDEIAFCNFPPIIGYENHIGAKADYHFMNAHDPNPYPKNIIDNLGLTHILNTHPSPHEGYKNCFPSYDIFYDPEYGKITTQYFKKNYNLDPSTGLQAFYYFVKKEEYKTIGLVGFDYFKVGEKGYYYPVNEVQSTLKYLYSNDGSKPFDRKGIRIQENSHNSKKTEELVQSLASKYNKIILEPK